ncbi:unnamed protein product [Aphanomyces euteiches]
MAFNQPSQGSPVVMAHEQAAMDSVVYDERTLKSVNRKNVKSFRPDQAGDDEELNASPARRLMDINRKLPGGFGYETTGERIETRRDSAAGKFLSKMDREFKQKRGARRQNSGDSTGGKKSLGSRILGRFDRQKSGGRKLWSL